MGLFTLAVAGGGFMLIGAWEALTSPAPSSDSCRTTSDSQIPSQSSKQSAMINPFLSSVNFIFISILSIFFVLNSLVSLIDALNTNDRVGSALQLQVLAIASLFLLYSILGFLTNFTNSFYLPSSILNLIALFAFVEEFLLFDLQRKDTAGIENRYFDLLLVPITICIVATILQLKTPNSYFPIFGRGIGLILQGTWFLQMGFSFYTNAITHDCSLYEKSRGNYTVKCKGHIEYHRGRAIATLQFNCHLALIVVLVAGVYTIIARKNGIQHGDFVQYRPLGAEIEHLDKQAQFTLDSDEDDEGTKEEEIVVKQKGAAVEMVVNGGSH